MVSKVAAKTSENSFDAIGQKWAVSYKRVSTVNQKLYRQDQALKDWLAAHPEYKEDVEAGVEDWKTGRDANRLDWFLSAGYPSGTVLLVEDMDRFSRMQIDEGIDLLRTMFSAGYGLAICGEDWDGEILTTFNKRGEQIVRELNRARRESDRKKERADGAARQRREYIRNGEFSKGFRPGDGRSPFWVDFFPKARGGNGEFKLNDHKWLIQRIFELGRTMGAGKIAIQLRNEGVVHPRPRNKKKKPKPLSPGTVRYYLSNRSVLGEYEFSEGKSNKTIGEPVKGVFPPVVDGETWEEVRSMVQRRHKGGYGNPGSKLYNLFQDRTYCGQCNASFTEKLPFATAGVRPQTHTLADGTKTRYLMVKCHHGAKDHKACNTHGLQVGVPYDEEFLLNLLAGFRWESFYNAEDHAKALKGAEDEVLAAEGVRNDKQRVVDNNARVMGDLMDEGEAIPAELRERYERNKAALDEAQARVDFTRSKLNGIQSRKQGKEAAAVTRLKIKNFMEHGRHDYEKRVEFNQWIKREGLVLISVPVFHKMGAQGLSIQVGRFDGDTLVEAALLDHTVTDGPCTPEEQKALIDEWQKTGEHPGLDMAMDADGNIYERIDGEWVKT